MAFSTPTHLLFLFLCSFLFKSLSWSTTPGESQGDFKKWVSWNVEQYNRKATVGLQYNPGSSPPGWENIDMKLREAEENKMTVIVSQNGDGDFTSITEALDSIPKENKRRVILEIRPGVYREKIEISKFKPFITFLGNVENPPIITGNHTAADLGKDGKPLRTINSATIAIKSDYFIARNMKFENTASHLGNHTIQAVALRISGNKAAFYDCGFYGYQDTLYDHKGMHYFKNCFIQGTIDFIFGYGRSLYENCYLNSIANFVSALTAQKRSMSSLQSGFSFVNNKVTGSGKIYLGRAWGDYSRVIFSYSFMDEVVMPEGWNDWGIPERESTVYYGEYQCSGPGANRTRRVTWSRSLTDEEAKPFIGIYYIDGDKWLLSGA